MVVGSNQPSLHILGSSRSILYTNPANFNPLKQTIAPPMLAVGYVLFPVSLTPQTIPPKLLMSTLYLYTNHEQHHRS